MQTQEASGKRPRNLRSTVRFIYALLMTALLCWASRIYFSFNIEFWEFWTFAIGFWTTVRIILESAGLLLIIDRIVHFTEGSDWTFLDRKLFKQNINFIPFDYRLLRYPFMAVLLFNLPTLAFIEELVFRHGFGIYPTMSWGDAVLRSLGFGLIHCLVGVPLRIGFIMTIGGLWFSHQYFAGGIVLATLSHFAYNTIAFAFLVGKWCRTRKNPFAE